MRNKKTILNKSFKSGGEYKRLNIGNIITENYSKYNKEQKKNLLEGKYKPLLETAKKIKEIKLSEYEKDKAFLESQRRLDKGSDDKNFAIEVKENIENNKLRQSLYIIIWGWILSTSKYIFENLKIFAHFIYVNLKLIITTIILAVKWLLEKILNPFLSPIFLTLFTKTVELLKSLLPHILTFLQHLLNLLFGQSALAYTLMFCLTILLIAHFIFGVPLPTFDNAAPTGSAGSAGGSGGTDGAGGLGGLGIPGIPSTSAGGATTSNGDSTAEQSTDCETSNDELEKYFSIENSFTNFKNNPGEFLIKLLSKGPLLILDKIFPGELKRTINSNLNKISLSLNRITNTPTVIDKNYNTREEINTGRSDNIYNIDLSLVKPSIDEASNYSLSSKLKSTIEYGTEKRVYSLGRPKDIIWDMPIKDYINSDYSYVPDSVKSLKVSNDRTDKKYNEYLSLEDKKSITIPWEETAGIYILKTSKAYFSNSKHKDLANILNDVPGSSTKSSINTILYDKIDNDKKRKMFNDDVENNRLNEFL